MAGSAKIKRHVKRGERIAAVEPGTHIIEAQGLTLKTPLGCPYSDIDITVDQGEVFAIRGRNGSGKTALLLTLAGRTRFTKGELTVCGCSLPRQMREVQKRVGLGLIENINDLPDNQIVRYAIEAEFELYKRTLTKQDVAHYLDEWQLGDIGDKRIRDLDEDNLTRLGIALAWAGHPDIMAIDSVENQLTKDQSTAIMGDLVKLARDRNVTILVGVIERDLAAMADNALYL